MHKECIKSVYTYLGSQGRREAEVAGHLHLSGGANELVADHAAHLGAALVADDADGGLLVGLVEGLAHAAHAASDEGVDAAAKALVGSEGDDEGVVGDVVKGGLVLDVGEVDLAGLAGDGLGPLVIGAGGAEPLGVGRELGRGDHLHGGGNLHDVLGTLDLHEQLLLGGHAASDDELSRTHIWLELGLECGVWTI